MEQKRRTGWRYVEMENNIEEQTGITSCHAPPHKKQENNRPASYANVYVTETQQRYLISQTAEILEQASKQEIERKNLKA